MKRNILQGMKKKRRHEEAKQKRIKEVPKHTAQRRLFTLNKVAECRSVCHICRRRIKLGHIATM